MSSMGVASGQPWRSTTMPSSAGPRSCRQRTSPPGHAQARGGEGHAETVVLIRHGEKPVSGLGQLSCQGLNRALALPGVLMAKLGRPTVRVCRDRDCTS